jgi:hypothetical protein
VLGLPLHRTPREKEENVVPRIVTALVAVILIVHGLVHLMGTAVYARHAQIKGLTYKTTLLNGRWDLGEGGIRIFGGLLSFAVKGILCSPPM